jgi:hypothetical protein
MHVHSLTARRPGPARWVARWFLAVAICLLLSAEAAAPATPPAQSQSSALVAPASP